MKLLSKLGEIFDSINRILIIISGVLVIILMLLTSYWAVMRYFFQSPLSWGNEISEYMLYAIPLLGAAWLLKRGGHVKVDALVNRLSLKPRTILQIATGVICIIVCLIITWYGILTTLEHFQENIIIPKILPVPKFILLAFIPLGFFLLSLEFIRQCYHHVLSLIKPSAKDLSS